MHEASLARGLLEAILRSAASEKARRVRRARGWIADTEALSRESLTAHFAALARGTLAEGAELVLEIIHVEARCRACHAVFAPDHHLLLCPHCKHDEADLLGREGLGLDALDIE